MGGLALQVSNRPNIPRRHIALAEFSRADQGVGCTLEHDGLAGSGLPAFQSNGGPGRHHPARLQPHSFEAMVPEVPGSLRRVSLLGIFGLYAGPEQEATDTFGATIRGYDGKQESFRFDLLNGGFYTDARDLAFRLWLNGEGGSVETVGQIEWDGAPARVDLVTLDVPDDTVTRTIRFTDMGSPASFVVFDVFLEFGLAAGCPFRANSGNVSLSELASVVRVGDRVRFAKAIEQLDRSIEKSMDLDEARGQSLTFLAVVTAASLELGAPRDMVRVGLQAARELDKVDTREGIREAIHRILREVAEPLFTRSGHPTAHLIDRALAMVERNYAKDLTDVSMADYVGMSTSHFRALFRQATGQPFHKYLVNLRLEKAKSLLQDGDLPVSKVAAMVGFAGLSHFSRAFSSRFHSSPTSIRRPHSPAS